MRPRIEIKYNPLPKQAEFHRSKKKFRVYMGGFGSGKTLCGVAECIQLSLEYPNNLGLVGRMTYPELRDTTWKELLDFPVIVNGNEMRLADSPLVKKYSSAKHEIQFGNGSVIIGRPLEDAFDKLAKGLNLGWFYIDEMTEANEEIWSGLEGRLRRAGVRHTGFGTTNPEGHDWVWKKFISQPGADDFLVVSPSTDNTYLPEGYIDGLINRYPEEWVKRYVYGSTETFEGLVFKDFQDKKPYVIPPFEIPERWYRFIGMDHGYRNPSAILWGAVDPDGNLYIYDEFYASGHVISELSEIIQTKTSKDKIQLYLIDPSCGNRNGQTGRSVMDEFSEYGLYFQGANNDVRAGINHVQEYFKLREGKPRIRIFSECRNLRTELQTYRWKDLKIGAATDSPEKPVKKGDHSVDALRYMVNYLYGMPMKKPGLTGWRKWMKERSQTDNHWMAA